MSFFGKKSEKWVKSQKIVENHHPWGSKLTLGEGQTTPKLVKMTHFWVVLGWVKMTQK